MIDGVLQSIAINEHILWSAAIFLPHRRFIDQIQRK